ASTVRLAGYKTARACCVGGVQSDAYALRAVMAPNDSGGNFGRYLGARSATSLHWILPIMPSSSRESSARTKSWSTTQMGRTERSVEQPAKDCDGQAGRTVNKIQHGASPGQCANRKRFSSANAPLEIEKLITK